MIATLPDPAFVAGLLRQAASGCVMPYYSETRSSRKADGSIVTQADLHCQSFLQQALFQAYPDIPLLGEEMEPDEQAELLEKSRTMPIWVLDPVDGTSNFAASLPIFGISLALLQAGEAHMGWVYDPVRDEMFFAERGRGAWLNDERMEGRAAVPMKRAVGVIDLKRLPLAMRQRLVSEMPFHSQRSFGSAVIEWCWLAAGRYHFYLHGGQKLWDIAAGNLILAEAGGVMQALDGNPLRLDALRSQSVLACLDTALLAEWRDWLAPG
ncbi:inositol monophosphatase family protein [Thermithiobacillus plumbiphilus]|uniref:Inositol monophosphatase family protein n=1 Tax=Thermithiobacillus plumbiphilus TaxID=1729899 RepID=A0ABU9D8F5_9PROT